MSFPYPGPELIKGFYWGLWGTQRLLLGTIKDDGLRLIFLILRGKAMMYVDKKYFFLGLLGCDKPV